MFGYVCSLAAVNFAVDYLLLMGTSRLCGERPFGLRLLLASLTGAVCSLLCVWPVLAFLGEFLIRTITLWFVVILAFGFHISSLRTGSIYILLRLALYGVAAGLEEGGFVGNSVSAILIVILCVLGQIDVSSEGSYIPVELSFADKHIKIKALKDTGNMLRDPVTGKPVLVVGADVANVLTGLTKEQLAKPSEAIISSSIPGLRVIPFKTIGQSGGLLLALRMRNVTIAGQKGSYIVAFAPESLGVKGSYQALAGGM